MCREITDARGLACPEPLIAFTGAAAKSGVDEIEISFDCGAARDNIIREAARLAWRMDSVVEAGNGTVMTLSRKT